MKAQPLQLQLSQQQEHQPQLGTYYVDIPALPPPQQQIQMAPAIIQGAPIDQNNAELARSDAYLYEAMRGKGLATQEQVSVARQRYFNVQLSHAPVMAHLGVGVAAAIENTQNVMDQGFTNMQNTIYQRFNAMDRRFDSLDARLENMGRRNINLACNSQTDANAQLIPLVKERPGLGPVLAGNFEPIVIEDLSVQVGDPVQQYFPANFDEIHNLSHAEINFLSQMHNNSFRIVGSDAIGTWRRKFEDFIMRG